MTKSMRRCICTLFLYFIIPSAYAGLIEIVSVSSNGEQGVFSSKNPSVSADGRFVAFTSFAPNLVAGDTNNETDVFVHDRETVTTERISVSSSGEQGLDYGGFFGSRTLSISADGRFVAFESRASNLVVGDTNNETDVFVHDRETATTERISVSSSGAQGNIPYSDSPSISADGRFVAFASFATNLVDGDTNGNRDVFVHDRATGTTERVSVSSSGEQTDFFNFSRDPSISADGRFVAFESNAGNLVDGDTNNRDDIFVHDRDTRTTERISVSSSGEQTNVYYTLNSSISADGRFVSFDSDATNLVDGDTNDNPDVFVAENPLIINLQGEPVIDGASESGVYFWRAADGRTLMQVVAGDPAENGQIADFDGRITAGSAISALQAIGLESSDSLIQSSISRVDFKLLAQRPWNDQISFVADNTEPLCVDLSVYVGGLFLGPDKVEVTSPFDIHGMQSCGKLDGEPVIDATSESGVYVWRNPFGRYALKVVAGGAQEQGVPAVFSGSIVSDGSLRDLTDITLESSDVLTLTAANQIDFDLSAQRPWSDRFDFSLTDAAAICIELDQYVGGLFLGRDKMEVTPPYNSNGLTVCDNLTIAVDGTPPVNPTMDAGWFIWRNNGVWHNRFVTGGTTHRFNGSYSSSSAMTSLAPISIESNDGLGTLPSGRLDFSLRVIDPYVDGFNLVVDANASTCVTLAPFEHRLFSIYLGPNRVQMPQSFDLNTLSGCRNGRGITTLGKPSIDRTADRGIFLWERSTNDWSAEVVTGNTTQSVIDVDVLSQQLLSNIVKVNIEPSDVFTELPQQLDLTLKVTAPWHDGFEFSAQPQSATCISTPTMPIYLGPDRVFIGSSINLDTQVGCQ